VPRKPAPSETTGEVPRRTGTGSGRRGLVRGSWCKRPRPPAVDEQKVGQCPPLSMLISRFIAAQRPPSEVPSDPSGLSARSGRSGHPSVSLISSFAAIKPGEAKNGGLETRHRCAGYAKNTVRATYPGFQSPSRIPAGGSVLPAPPAAAGFGDAPSMPGLLSLTVASGHA